MQLLYCLQFSDQDFEVTREQFLGGNARRRRGWGPFADDLARQTWENRESLDLAIAPVLHKWKIDRLALTDRLCLRMALAEFKHFGEIPLRVTINEYVELVKSFGTDDSPKYVNAVLDRLAEDFRHKDFGGGATSEKARESGQAKGPAGSTRPTEPIGPSALIGSPAPSEPAELTEPSSPEDDAAEAVPIDEADLLGDLGDMGEACDMSETGDTDVAADPPSPETHTAPSADKP